MNYPKLLLFILLIPVFSFAQSNYKPGYLVKTTGDTTRGLIDYREWERNPSSISFKDGAGSPVQTILPAGIKAFALNGMAYYESHTVAISKDTVDVSNIPRVLDTGSTTATVFLRVLNKGKNVSLYAYNDDLKMHFYIADNTTGEVQELGYHLYYDAEGNGKVKTLNQFHAQLEVLAQKFGKNMYQLTKTIALSPYRQQDLLKIAIALNGTAAGSNGYAKSADQQFTPASALGTRWFIGGGVADNAIKFDNRTSSTLSFPNKSSVFPKLSLGLDIIPNKNTQQIFLRAELAITGGQYKFSSTGSTTFPITPSQTLNLSQYNVSLIPQIAWNAYNTDELKVFISAGVAINYSIYNDYKLVSDYGTSNTSQDKYPPLNKTWASFPFKTGLQLNHKAEFYAEYIPPSSLTFNAADFEGKLSSFQLGFNYLFGVK